MKVDGVTSAITSTNRTLPAPAIEPPVEEFPQDAPQSSEPPETEELPGVIRNLLEGHFKGVSDVRLRINHFEALQSVDQEQIQALIDENAGLLESIGQNLSDLLNYTEEPPAAEEASADTPVTTESAAPEGLTQEQQVFATDASEITIKLLNSEDRSKNTLLNLVADLRSALTKLAESLNPPSVTTTEETPPPLSVDGEDDGGMTAVESPSDFDILVSDFIDDLNSIFMFMTALDDLTQKLSSGGGLPELSEPNGNGSAYNKFLAQYNDLYFSGEPNNVPPTLDTAV